MRRAAAALFVAAWCSTAPSATSPSEPPPDPLLAPFAPSAWGRDARFLLTSPSRWDQTDALWAFGAAWTTYALHAHREEIREWALRTRSDDRSHVLDAARNMGKAAVPPTVALIAGLVALKTRDPRETTTSALVLESAAWSAAFTAVGQFVLDTERPRDGDAVRLFQCCGHGVSLDAALAASIVPVLRRQYLVVTPADSRGARAGKRIAVVALYAGAVLTAAQRVDADAHWASDAFLGLVTGLYVGETLCDARGLPGGGRRRWSAGPSPDGRGVTVLIRW